ncbi:MAG: OmpA family protein [Treponema sp.]|nr:OmpA family protein [Treponema sp.]
MSRLRILFPLLFLFFLTQALGAAEFNFTFRAGDKYRILSTVHHDIYIDRVLSFQAEILNRISVDVHSTQGERGLHSATFQTAERTVPVGEEADRGALFTWSRDYYSEFSQGPSGQMNVTPGFFFPMVRDLPLFPGGPLNPGDTWSAPGMEVHDFRANFSIEEPFMMPFMADYTYLGPQVWQGRSYPAFRVSYRIFWDEGKARQGLSELALRRILVASDQILYWEDGRIIAYEEVFRTIIYLTNGSTWEYRGQAEAQIVDSQPMDREALAAEISQAVAALPDISVRVADEGVIISLENIQFDPDSAVLRPTEYPKLDRIAEILLAYPDRDIMVGGHTALAGTAAGRMQLSLERAQAVADQLLRRNVRSPERLIIRGYGAEQPLADNATPQGMERNRRVEIIILEN